MSRFDVEPTPLSGLMRVSRQRLGDARGSLTRIFCADELRAGGWLEPVAQINHTLTLQAGTVRGMHFQYPPHADAKLVSCLRGEVWDVALDLRSGSATFLQWHAERLSADNGLALLIPSGFAHGFQALTDNAEMLYCHSHPHEPGAEGGLHALDARLAITWPLPVIGLSPRDAAHPRLEQGFAGMRV